MNMNLKGIMKSLNAKPGQVVSDPYARAFSPQLTEEEHKNHQVSMAQGSLESIMRHTKELIQKFGKEERDIPAWILDHVAKGEVYLQQANDQFHEWEVKEAKKNLREGEWSKIMAGVRKGDQSGPWSLVIIDGANKKKVIYQTLVKIKDAIPAEYEHLKKKYKGDYISIEDKSGKVVYNGRLG